jgi:hypothetical protein
MTLFKALKRGWRIAFPGDITKKFSKEEAEKRALEIGLGMNVVTDRKFEQEMRDYIEKSGRKGFFFQK